MTQTDSYVKTGEVANTGVPWYEAPLKLPLPRYVEDLFEIYVGLCPSQAASHIESVRIKAWSIMPYPCVGQHAFIHTPISHRPIYSEILHRLKCGATFLDVGSCMGQEFRRFAADGAMSSNMYALDVNTDFWNLGYDLFRDRGRLPVHHIVANILDDDKGGPELAALVGKIDVFHAGSFFHLFDWQSQLQALQRLIALSTTDAVFVGHHTGREPAKETSIGDQPRYFHDAASWQRLWREAEKITGTKWAVETVFGDYSILGLKSDFTWQGPFARALAFTARRITSQKLA
ncbi:hypothetical protein MMC11_008669 [Xylographa trunciseda]|nr:hypothetical protein [Xylographa trunciseda]